MIELTRKYKTDELEKDINIEIIFQGQLFFRRSSRRMERSQEYPN